MKKILGCFFDLKKLQLENNAAATADAVIPMNSLRAIFSTLYSPIRGLVGPNVYFFTSSYVFSAAGVLYQPQEFQIKNYFLYPTGIANKG
jgi:hypothetical protein